MTRKQHSVNLFNALNTINIAANTLSWDVQAGLELAFDACDEIEATNYGPVERAAACKFLKQAARDLKQAFNTLYVVLPWESLQKDSIREQVKEGFAYWQRVTRDARAVVRHASEALFVVDDLDD